MKVIIPVAGIGTRLRPHTHTVPKALIPVAGKPMLAHILDQLTEFDITDVILIVGYLGDKIVKFVKDNYNFKVSFVEQERRLGLGHAIYLANEYVQEEEPVLSILGDTLFEANLKEVVNGDYSSIGVKKVDNPQRFGIVTVNDDGFIENLVEKPEEFVGDLAVVGIYFIKNPKVLFDSLQYIVGNNIKTKGEYQLTDALNHMLKQGEKMTAFQVKGWYDCGKPDTLLDTNKRLLELREDLQPQDYPGSILIQPVSIAKGVKIKNSIIGPYVTIDENSVIKKSIVENSIIASNAVVENISLKKSIIGDYAQVYGKSNKLNVGDSSEINFE